MDCIILDVASPVGIIIGIGLPLLIVIGVLLGLSIFFIRHKVQKQKTDSNRDKTDQ